MANNKKRRARQKWLAAGLVFVLLIACVAFLPPGYRLNLHGDPNVHQLAHIAAFAAIGYLVFRGTRAARTHLWVAGCLVLFAVGTEVGEHLLFQSPMEYNDVVADLAGLFLGAFLATTIRRLKSKAAAAAFIPRS